MKPRFETTVNDVPEANAMHGTIRTLTRQLSRYCDVLTDCEIVLGREEMLRPRRSNYDVSIRMELAGEGAPVCCSDRSDSLDSALYAAFADARRCLDAFRERRPRRRVRSRVD